MKIFVRAFVVVLALTGAVASTQASTVTTARSITASSSLKALPVPTCPPNTNDPNPCNVSAMGR